MHEPGLSEYDILRAEYEEEMFPITMDITPSEVREIIAKRRHMESMVGTNGSIKLTMKIASSVHTLMDALATHQENREEALRKQALEDLEAEDEDDLEEEIDPVDED